MAGSPNNDVPTESITPEAAQAQVTEWRAAGLLSKAFLLQEANKVATTRNATHAELDATARIPDESKRELEPQQIETLVLQIKTNFTTNGTELPNLHPKAMWADVEKALLASPKLLFGLHQMEETGGKVDVIAEDEGNFLFGDTSAESPSGRRNVVFDKAAEELLRTNRPNEICAGNAVDMSAGWGVDLMDDPQYRALQKLGRFDERTWGWLKTSSDSRRRGDALGGDRYGGSVGVDEGDATNRNGDGGFRCVLRVPKAKV